MIKVKSHAGCFLHEMADKYAEMHCQSDAEAISHGLNKYGLHPLCSFACICLAEITYARLRARATTWWSWSTWVKAFSLLYHCQKAMKEEP